MYRAYGAANRDDLGRLRLFLPSATRGQVEKPQPVSVSPQVDVKFTR